MPKPVRRKVAKKRSSKKKPVRSISKRPAKKSRKKASKRVTKKTSTRPARKTSKSSKKVTKASKRPAVTGAMASLQFAGLSGTMQNKLRAVNFASTAAATKSVRALKLTRTTLAPAIGGFFKKSENDAVKFTKALAGSWKSDREGHEHTGALMDWARKGGLKQRRIVCRALRQSGKSLHVIDGIGGMNRDNARKFMKDYFAEGGTEDSVAEWFQRAGSILRKHEPTKSGTDGIFGKIWGAVKSAVKTVGDALKSAGKSLAKAIKKVASWTVSKVTDFVEGLIRAGRKVAEILSEAAKKGVSALKKFVTGVVKAGRRIGEIFAWVARKTFSTIKTVVSEVMKAGKKLVHVVLDMVKQTASFIRNGIKALISLGKRVVDILKTVATKALSVVQKVVSGLLSAGKSILSILGEAARRVSKAVKNVTIALVRLGKSAASIMSSVFSKLGSALFRPVVDALMRAGQSVAKLLKAAVGRGWSLVQSVGRALAELGKRVRDVLHVVARMATTAIEKTIKGMILAGKKIASIMREVVKFTGAALKKLVKGIYKAVRKVGTILVAFVRSKINTIRMVLDGLLSIGARLVDVITSVVTDVAAGFRKGFFQGLIAIGQSAKKIMVEALKTAGAIAGLALATLLDVLGGHRGLTTEEMRQARRVFGTSIDLRRVKVASASLASDLIHKINGNRPFTTMYVINFASWDKVDMKTLIHELAHVWQGVIAGPVYMVEALHAQMVGEGYNVTDQMLRDRGNKLSNFNREQQAVIAEEYWYERWGFDEYPDSKNVRNLDANLLAPYAREMKSTKKATFHPAIPVFRATVKPQRMLKLRMKAGKPVLA